MDKYLIAFSVLYCSKKELGILKMSERQQKIFFKLPAFNVKVLKTALFGMLYK